ncbi:LysR substrate-binding domain-containing protein [Iodobacter fluviatilis]|uniref:LysR substrate-binding domain-containing protein n=1 Tax=Iodobacter fluviatilis TaxID=537 RepID=UPI0010217A85|nr:LysR substrate-binding domain-containing protein [Iodobacter fluviatilis]
MYRYRSGHPPRRACLSAARDVAISKLDIEDLQAKVEGPLRINATQSFGQSILSPILVEFSLKYPDLRIELAACRT